MHELPIIDVVNVHLHGCSTKTVTNTKQLVMILLKTHHIDDLLCIHDIIKPDIYRSNISILSRGQDIEYAYMCHGKCLDSSVPSHHDYELPRQQR